jgi:hypothetical protein
MGGVQVSMRLSPKQAGALYMKSEAQKEELADLRAKLDPRQWTPEMRDAWHRELPDMVKAFEALRNA